MSLFWLQLLGAASKCSFQAQLADRLARSRLFPCDAAGLDDSVQMC